MRLRIVAALGLAAGLIAAPGFAAEPAAPAGGAPAPAPAAGAPTPAPAPGAEPMAKRPMHHAPMHAHRMPMHRGMAHAMARPDSEHTTIEQLNAMSLQAAKKGQNFTPPAGQK